MIEVGPPTVSCRCAGLQLTAKVKARARDIFGFGDALNMSTITSNSGFVRAARAQGVRLCVLEITGGGRAVESVPSLA